MSVINLNPHQSICIGHDETGLNTSELKETLDKLKAIGGDNATEFSIFKWATMEKGAVKVNGWAVSIVNDRIGELYNGSDEFIAYLVDDTKVGAGNRALKLFESLDEVEMMLGNEFSIYSFKVESSL
ncbi:hypothetical protein VCHA53O466_40035 [Vibrio chagasii]|nr:hypothetical protein VCHA53O466_40035 [Vibrio chagasii]